MNYGMMWSSRQLPRCLVSRQIDASAQFCLGKAPAAAARLVLEKLSRLGLEFFLPQLESLSNSIDFSFLDCSSSNAA
jgi:hypothetical protein